MQIKLFNKIDKKGLDILTKAGYECAESVENPVGVLVRSAVLHEEKFPESLVAIARAGAGVNNIPLERCVNEGIVVYNTPGANANAVKELVICGLILAARPVVKGAIWADGLKDEENGVARVEKEKSKFAGIEIEGKTLGVVGLGAIGARVALAAHALGMKVVGCDPYLAPATKAMLEGKAEVLESYDELYKEADFITIHVPSLPSTRGMFNKETIAKCKDGVRILNFARGDLANTQDMLEALEAGKVAVYVTDFPAQEMLGNAQVVALPHLGASTEEAETNCAIFAAEELRELFEQGIVRNSVNFPNYLEKKTTDNRVLVLAAEEADKAAAKAETVLAEAGKVFEGAHRRVVASKALARGTAILVVLDLDSRPGEKELEAVKKIAGVTRVLKA